MLIKYVSSVLFGFSLLIQTRSEVTEITLSNGHKMPVLGIGTCCSISKTMVTTMLKEAIDVGYRLIDTAYIYGNEVEVGLAVEEKIAEAKVKREDMFITTKLWNTFHSKSRATEGIRLALKKLNLKYIDLMLIHWPMGYAEGVNDMPKNSNNEMIGSNVDYLETWRALEESVNQGLVKSIGVSNFNGEQIERLVKNAKIKPVVNQIESHPHLTQKPLIELCKRHDIVVTAYSPLGGGQLIDEKTLKRIGGQHQKSSAQVMIRYQIQRGVTAVVRSTQKSRIEENSKVFDFSLTTHEMNEIDGLNTDRRYNTESAAKNLKYYPFK